MSKEPDKQEEAGTEATPAKTAEGSFYEAKFGIEAMQSEPYENGFTWRAVLGAIFVAFVMLPGVIFMGLMIGQDLGGAAEWVTIILFVELARRSFIVLKKQELYMLKYTVGSLSSIQGGMAVGGGVFAWMVVNRYFRNSEAFHNFGIADEVPDWFAPFGDAAYAPFTDLSVWGPVIGVLVGSMVLSKITQLMLGFLAYKITADVEKLPFPMAPVHAEGAIALAETSQDKGKKNFRQYCFSVGIMCGAVFGLFYVAVPTITNAVFGKTYQLLPIPFWDLTTSYEGFLTWLFGRTMGGGTMGISLNLGLLFVGFVLPWRIVIGMIVTNSLVQFLINPYLYHLGRMPHWSPGKDAIQTHVAAQVDVYLSFGIGTALAIFMVGLFGMVKGLLKYSREKQAGATGLDISKLWTQDKARGDPPTWLALLLWVGASILFVLLSNHLINSGLEEEANRFPILWLVGFAFVVSPLQTYINARMSGIAGQQVGLPMVAQAAIFASGTRRVNVWFAPMPLFNYGSQADRYREVQLTRTKFTSIFKAELFVFPLLLFASFIFWSYILGLGPVPSENYPYVQKFWPQFAQMRALWASSMQEGNSLLLQSLNVNYILAGLGVAAAAFSGFGLAGISSQYIYGGLSAMMSYPHTVMMIFIGACVGRFVLRKRFGTEKWQNFAPILAVGFGAGLGLIGMLSIAINFLWVSIGTNY